MSIYNKPDLKINIGCNTPSFHKKINSMNFSSSNTGRSQQDNSKKYLSKNKIDLKHHPNINSESNVINYNNQQIIPNSGINKVLTSANLKNRRIEIDLNKNNSPISSKFNKSVGDSNLLFRHKQSTSQNNINNKIINYNTNNAKEINHNKSKNSLNNINININISKKIISTYYNKSKDKKNLIVKKKSINSLNNSNKKESKNNKFTQINNNNFNSKEDIKKNNNEIIGKNQSERIFKKIQNNDSYLINYYSNQNKNNGNHNSLAYFSTNSNMSTNTNKNNNMNNSNIYTSNNPNYTRDDIYNNYYTNRNINKKNYNNAFNKIIKENKSTCFSQFQSPIGINHTQGNNINSIQNYLKYLNIGQKNKNYKNTPIISKNKAHKLSANNINYNHNNTESNIYCNNYNSIYNYETYTTFSQNNYNKLNDENDNLIPNLKNKKPGVINKKGDIKEINGFQIGSPEELHYFYIKLLQKGKKVNFDIKNKK